MKLVQKDGLQIAIWSMDESLDQLTAQLNLNEVDQGEFNKLNHNKRKREWLASRAALRLGLANAETVSYADTGKPGLETTALSFSHCLPIAGALIHPKIAGMDIQHPDPKIEAIQTKFAHPEELERAHASKRELDYLTILWSAKEALFKVYGKGLAFAEQLRINDFEPGQNTIQARVLKEDLVIEHILKVFRVLDHWVVYVAE